jgi:hypothetical protein
LVRFAVTNLAHSRLRAVLLHQLDNFTSIGSLADIAPYFEPPFNIPDPNISMLAPLATRTTSQLAEIVKARWTPISTNAKQLRWFTAPLDANPTSIDGIVTYGECETNTIYIAVEIQDNDSSLTTSVLQGIDFIPPKLSSFSALHPCNTPTLRATETQMLMH